MSGAHLRSGRKRAEDPTSTRTEQVRASFRLREVEDLQAIAAAWAVPVATVVWALVATELARLRREAVDLGHATIAVRATARTIAQMGIEPSLEGWEMDAQP